MQAFSVWETRTISDCTWWIWLPDSPKNYFVECQVCVFSLPSPKVAQVVSSKFMAEWKPTGFISAPNPSGPVRYTSYPATALTHWSLNILHPTAFSYQAFQRSSVLPESGTLIQGKKRMLRVCWKQLQVLVTWCSGMNALQKEQLHIIDYWNTNTRFKK